MTIERSATENTYIAGAVEASINVGLVALLAAVCLLILAPFVPIIAWGIIISVASYPAVRRLQSALQGQFEGRRKRISPHLVRAPQEPTDGVIQQFYEQLRDVLRHSVVRDGEWRLLECAPAWDGNWTSDCFVACLWQSATGERRLVVVNYAGSQSQCYVRLPSESGGQTVGFNDLMGATRFDREPGDLDARGLYPDMPAWGYHVFEITPSAVAHADEGVLATQGA